MAKGADTLSLSSATAPEGRTNVVQLVSTEATSILSVSLYGSRAEVSRVATIDLPAGQNRVTITGLPNAILDNTLRCVC